MIRKARLQATKHRVPVSSATLVPYVLGLPGTAHRAGARSRPPGQELLRSALEALFLIERVAEVLLADAGRHAGIAHYGSAARLEFRKAARSPPAVRSDRRGLPSASSSRC